MRLIVTLLVLCTAVAQSFAQITVELPVVFQASAPQSKNYTLTIGVDSRATACVDSILNEVDMPPPPPDFFPVLLPGCTDPESETVITLHRDFRPITSSTLRYAYQVRLTRGPDLADVIMTWNKNLPQYVDSAFIEIEFADTLNMAEQEQYILTNDFIRQLYVVVYYTVPVVSVGDAVTTEEMPALFPQPAGETAMFTTRSYKGGRYELYTALGEHVIAGEVSHDELMALPVGRLSAGMYMLHLRSLAGKSTVLRFVKK